ncbi:MAG TPA: hypothetical protein VHG51_17620 [Longimicrobiaceae bacterium]|nr:hypothetical protein [Longimicrobiaceae bacterium]
MRRTVLACALALPALAACRSGDVADGARAPAAPGQPREIA